MYCYLYQILIFKRIRLRTWNLPITWCPPKASYIGILPGTPWCPPCRCPRKPRCSSDAAFCIVETEQSAVKSNGKKCRRSA